MSKDKLLAQIKILDLWFEENEYKGLDPYDLFDTRLFHKFIDIKYRILRKVNRKFISWFIFLFPSFVVKLFNKKSNINAKGMGLLLKAKCNLYDVTGDQKYLDRVLYISNWLIENRTQGLHGYGWGYPFDWSGSNFIPKNTPSSVVSTVIGDGFFSLYKVTSNKLYLDICDKVCIFLSEDLNIDHIGDDSICFSYTPIDNNHVVNANLFVAEFLVRIGIEMCNSNYLALGKKVVNYVLKQQKLNGDFLYWGSEDADKLRNSFSNSDHYHTGFELRMLYKLWKMLGDFRIKRSIERYYNFYVNNFINNNFSINIFPRKKYPINIHACSEFLYCNCLISEEFTSKKVNIKKTFDWINKMMLDSDGLYSYEIRSLFGIHIRNRYKFNRWSQAWMFLALTECYKNDIL